MRSRWMRWTVLGVLVLLLAVSAPWIWAVSAATGHRYDVADAPSADVVLVLGTTVAPDGKPENRLAGRLTTAAELVAAGRAKVVLVSGDGGGESGNETAAMTGFLTGELGVDPARVVADPAGLDTYDSCIRARDVYGVRRLLVVTQGYHLSRAVTLCRALGIDAEGVPARCDGCSAALLAEKSVRDYFAAGKAAWDVVTRRDPAVVSPPSSAVAEALA